jgi:hypothetical protein
MTSTTPCVPSPDEAKHYYYGLPSKPLLVARSSTNVWLKPTGPAPDPAPKEIRPVSHQHRLREIWQATIGPALVKYLDSKEAKWTSLDPVCIGYEDEPSPPVIVWIGVVPGSLSAEDGVDIATQCKNILATNDIDDVHAEIRESVVKRWGAHAA